jgi:Fic family protein
LDGNGRIGRILIPVFLYEKGVLKSPTFYLSAFLESTREEYYARLLAISHKGDWKSWIEYFLRAVAVQAKADNQKASDIMSLYNTMKTTVGEATRSGFAIQALDFLFDRPIFNGSFFASKSRIPRASAAIILNKLLRAKVIERLEQGRGRSPAVYVFPSLLDVVRTA